MVKQDSAAGVHRENLKGCWRGEGPCEPGSAGVGGSSQRRCFPPIHSTGFLFLGWNLHCSAGGLHEAWATQARDPISALSSWVSGGKNLLYEYAGAACSGWCWLPRTESGEWNKVAACKTAECGREGGWKEEKRLEAVTNRIHGTRNSMLGNVRVLPGP